MTLKSKNHAIQHLIQWTRKWQSSHGLPQRVHTDNDTEIICREYTTYCVNHGIATHTGAPYTPQSQGMVERPNQTVKHLLWKTLHTLNLPNKYAVYLVPGVVNDLNDITHTTTNKSPHGIWSCCLALPNCNR
eukprot:GHVR01110331.1.p1 GENE.GHVR01110331.1~~GHVR01110331.1.p1  ORF type:complete len:132 (-),score=15.70 GHVR01110331.1:648-1043(-)